MNLARHAKGNALFLILIAVALFAALSYAVTQSGRGSGSVSKEKALLDAGVAQQCTAYVDRGVMTLTTVGGCTAAQVSYELPNGLNPNAQAPVNKSCHLFDPAGAGLAACGIYLQLAACDLTALAIGEKCPNADIVYAGVSSGHRLYAALADQGSISYNSGTTTGTTTTATNVLDGKLNTDKLVVLTDAGAPYLAAQACRGLGPDWYVPAASELTTLWNARTTGAFNGTYNLAGHYASSTETGPTAHRKMAFASGVISGSNKYDPWIIRCVRTD